MTNDVIISFQMNPIKACWDKNSMVALAFLDKKMMVALVKKRLPRNSEFSMLTLTLSHPNSHSIVYQTNEQSAIMKN